MSLIRTRSEIDPTDNDCLATTRGDIFRPTWPLPPYHLYSSSTMISPVVLDLGALAWNMAAAYIDAKALEAAATIRLTNIIALLIPFYNHACSSQSRLSV